MVKVLVETPLESCGISLTPTKRSSDVWLVKTYATGDLGLGEKRLRRLGGGEAPADRDANGAQHLSGLHCPGWTNHLDKHDRGDVGGGLRWKVLSLGEQRSSTATQGHHCWEDRSRKGCGPQLCSDRRCRQLTLLPHFCPGPALLLKVETGEELLNQGSGYRSGFQTNSQILWHSPSKR